MKACSCRKTNSRIGLYCTLRDFWVVFNSITINCKYLYTKFHESFNQTMSKQRVTHIIWRIFKLKTMKQSNKQMPYSLVDIHIHDSWSENTLQITFRAGNGIGLDIWTASPVFSSICAYIVGHCKHDNEYLIWA